MALKWSTVVLLLACELFAEAQIAAPTAKPQELPKKTEFAPTQPPSEAVKIREDVQVGKWKTRKRRLSGSQLSNDALREQLQMEKAEVCEDMKAFPGLDALEEEFKKELNENFTVGIHVNFTSWQYAPLDGDLESVTTLYECARLCDYDERCYRWAFGCDGGDGWCHHHSNQGQVESKDYAFTGVTRYATERLAMFAKVIEASRLAREAQERLQLEAMLADTTAARATAAAAGKAAIEDVKARLPALGARRLNTKHGKKDEDDIFGEGEL